MPDKTQGRAARRREVGLVGVLVGGVGVDRVANFRTALGRISWVVGRELATARGGV